VGPLFSQKHKVLYNEITQPIGDKPLEREERREAENDKVQRSDGDPQTRTLHNHGSIGH